MKTNLFSAALLCAALAFGGAAAFAEKAKAPAAPVNKKCPVEGEDVDPSITATHKGKTVAFCCKGCDKEFAKDPEKYMKELAAKGDDNTIKSEK